MVVVGRFKDNSRRCSRDGRSSCQSRCSTLLGTKQTPSKEEISENVLFATGQLFRSRKMCQFREGFNYFLRHYNIKRACRILNKLIFRNIEKLFVQINFYCNRVGPATHTPTPLWFKTKADLCDKYEIMRGLRRYVTHKPTSHHTTHIKQRPHEVGKKRELVKEINILVVFSILHEFT